MNARRWKQGVPALVAGGAMAVSATAGGQEREQDTALLETMEVTSPRLTREWLGSPNALGIVERQDLQQARQHLQLDETLNRVPGVFMQNRYNFAQDIRLSIRGFGARSPFGIRGVRLIVDGIPETTPDGQSQVDSIDLRSLDRVEVIRGPNSALYGNATGGVVQLTTQEGPADPFVSAQVTGGSHDFQSLGLKAGGQSGDWNYHVSAWHMDYDGYREQSRARKSMLRTNVRYDLTPTASLTGLFTYLDAPTTQDAGGLTLEQMQENRRQANMFSNNLNAGQEAEQYRLGLVYRQELGLEQAFVARTFYTNREFEQQLPFPGSSLVGYERDFYGVGLQYTGAAQFAGVPHRYTAGVDVEQQRDARYRYMVAFDGTVGAQALDQTERAGFIGVYVQDEMLLTDRLTGTLGARYDRVRFGIDDRFLAGGDDLSGRLTFDEFSYTGGLSYELTEEHRVYATVGNAFETPTFTEFANPAGTGGFNPDVGPQEATSFEVGFKGMNERFRYEAAVHYARVRNELVPFQLDDPADQRTYYRNAGRTSRQGVELGGTWFATDTVSMTGTYTYSDFEYRRFEDVAGNRFDGNRLPGIPRHSVFGEVAVRNPSGAFAILDVLFVDNVYTRNANDIEVPSYAVFNSRVGMNASVNGWHFETFVAVNNLLDKEYVSNVRINDANLRFYEPAPERNWFAGITVRR